MHQPTRSLLVISTNRSFSQLGAIALAVAAAISPAFAATDTFDNSAGTLIYTTATNWVDNTAPTSADDVIFDNSATTLTGTSLGIGAAAVANSLTFGSSTGTALGAFTFFNNNGATRTFGVTSGNITVDSSVTGTQTFFSTGGVTTLSSTSGGLQFINNSTTQTLVLGSILNYGSSPNITFSSAGGLITMDLTQGPILGSLNGGSATTVSIIKTGTGSLRTLILNGTGSHTFGGAITGTGVTGTSGLALTINGSGLVQTLTANNTFGGDVAITSGTLFVNGNQTGVGNYSIGATGTLGGSGSIANTNGRAVSAVAGAKFTPGSAAGVVGTFTINLSNATSTINLSLATNDTGAFVFDLASTAASDKLVLGTGGGAISLGTVNGADFAFNQIAGFGTGVYTLIDLNRAVTGTIDTTSFSMANGYTGALSYDALNNDVLLTVVPEPSTWSAILGGLGLLVGMQQLRRRRLN